MLDKRWNAQLLLLGLVAVLQGCHGDSLQPLRYEDALAAYELGGDSPNYICAIAAEKAAALEQEFFSVVLLEDKAYIQLAKAGLLEMPLKEAADEYTAYATQGIVLRVEVLSRANISEYEESADQRMRLAFSGALGDFAITGAAQSCGI